PTPYLNPPPCFDSARCLAEFVALVKREWAVRGDDPHLPPNFGAFTVLGTMKALAAWVALQAVTAELWNERTMKHVTQIVVLGSNSAIYSKNSITGFDEDRDDVDEEETMHITRTERKSGSDGSIVEGDILNRRISRGSLNADFVMTHVDDNEAFETPMSTMSSIYYPFRLSSTVSMSDEYNRELLHNLRRYSKFSLGAYGRDALGFFGVSLPPIPPAEADENDLNPHHFTFAHHTKTRMEYVSGFSQQQGMDATSAEEKTAPSYYLIRDHNSCSIILALRGTFSLNDLVVDLSCEEVSFKLPDEANDPSAPVYKVHSGMCTTAQDIATPGPGTVFNALKKALEENQGYGLVIVGHSLGAAIGSLLTLLLASPTTCTTTESSGLPPNRPVHAFAFAAPCAMSAPLSRRAERLITSLVYADDVITRLSFGSVRDLRNIAAWLVQGDKDEPLYANIIREAVNYQTGMYDTEPKKKDEIKNWFLSLRTTLHANMQNDKLYPGGRIYWVLPVNDADANANPNADARSVAHMNPDDPEGSSYKLYKIDDVEEVLSEIIFSRNMMFDHFPTQYEDVLLSL
ncbi:Alpha/Beta hydrolase protein, partial [Endogone sp. FLAS-F59071]